MFARASVKTPKRQQGLVLLVMIIIFVLAFTAYMFSNLSISKIRLDQAENTLIRLKKAKRAVINFAVTYSDRAVSNDYGVLPHPETFLNGDDGNMPGNWGTKNTNIVEWLPWRSLDLPNLKDNSGTCLFYAVSGTYKLGGTVQADMINEDSIGMFRVVNSAGTIVQGANIEDRVVALVIAPGGPLPGQLRTPLIVTSSCGQDYANVAAYLEGDGVTDNSSILAVVDTTDDFIHATESSGTEASPYNDRFLTITREEIWDAIVKRLDFKQDMETLTQALAMCLAEYANLPDNSSRRLPWPVKTNLGVTTNYRNNANYEDDDGASEGYSGRYPFDVGSSNDAIDADKLTEDSLFEIAGLCDNFGVDAEGITINLEADASKYRQLWNNWKDHFFYILSKGYEPDNSGVSTCAGSGACIKITPPPSPLPSPTEYAGAVIFSGSRFDGVTRNDKSVVSEYLEDGKANEFILEEINRTGDITYVYTDPQTDTENDIMYCIQDQPMVKPLDVIECL